MNTRQILDVINSDPVMRKIVIGVFARDQIPHKFHNFPCGFIVNTDTSDRPGKHWLAFYMESKNNVEFFDSYECFKRLWTILFVLSIE